jgi:hypothetical protein
MLNIRKAAGKIIRDPCNCDGKKGMTPSKIPSAIMI